MSVLCGFGYVTSLCGGPASRPSPMAGFSVVGGGVAPPYACCYPWSLCPMLFSRPVICLNFNLSNNSTSILLGISSLSSFVSNSGRNSLTSIRFFGWRPMSALALLEAFVLLP